MSIELIRPTEKHLPQLARICFEAFAGISDAHRFPYDIPNVEVAGMLMGMMVSRADVYGVAAVESAARETILGFNFVQMSDPVGGVGPICVDPRLQAKGVGKILMRHIVEWSLKNHGPMLRLMQDSFNMRSLSLYTSLGYTVRHPCVLMSVVPAAAADATVRALVPGDVAAADDLCREVYGVSRKNELAWMIANGGAIGCVPHGRFAGGRIVAAVVPGFFGYAVGRTHEDLLVVAEQAARVCPPPLHRLFVPATQGDFFRAALVRGFKAIKVMCLMSIGKYEEGAGAWSPSVGY